MSYELSKQVQRSLNRTEPNLENEDQITDMYRGASVCKEVLQDIQGCKTRLCPTGLTVPKGVDKRGVFQMNYSIK